jgi:hypothetical protein
MRKKKSRIKINQYPYGKQSSLVNKEDAKETTFYIGSAGISRNNPDYVAIEVVNTLFEGVLLQC